MGIPLQLRPFDAFLGADENIHSVIIPAIFSPGGSYNVYIDKYARVKKLPGYTKQNSSAITTDTGASAAAFTGLTSYRKISAGATTRTIIGILDDGVNEWEAWHSNDLGVTWTFDKDFGSTFSGKVPDFVQFGDVLYVCNGGIAPNKYSGSTWTTAGGTQSPTPTPSVVGTVGVLNGDYTYKLVSRDNTNTRSPGSVISAIKGVTNGQISLAWTADGNTNVTGTEVYRTTGTSQTFYFVSWVDGRTTVAFTDNVSDDTIIGNRVLEEHGDAPQSGAYFVVSHKQRAWWLGTDTYPARAWYSDAGNPESVYINNNLDFTDSSNIGDKLTGGVGDYEGKLVLFTERAVWEVTGTGAVIGNIRDWTRIKTNAQIGAVSKRSIVKMPAGAKYVDQNGVIQTTQASAIAYFTPYGDVRLLTHSFLGDGDTIISLPLKTTLSVFDYTYRHLVHAFHDTSNQQIIWFYPVTSGSTGQCSKGIVWNYRWGIWYALTTTPFASAIEAESSSAASVLLVGQSSSVTGGYVYKFLDGTSFDGAAINSQWMTKVIRGQDLQGNDEPSHTRRWRWADFIFQTNTTSPVLVEWLEGTATDTATALGSTSVNPATSSLTTSDAYTILSASGDSIAFGALSSQIKVILQGLTGRFLHDTGIRLRFSDTSTTSTWALEGFTVAYQTMEGQKRREQ